MKHMQGNSCKGKPLTRKLLTLLACALPFVALSAHPQADCGTAGGLVISVNALENGRYDVWGIAMDRENTPACALVMISGKCVFSCGPGSQRCEGGQQQLPFGEFELFNLPTEPDGTLKMQVFVQGLVSYTEKIDPDNFTDPMPPEPGEDNKVFEGSGNNGTKSYFACMNLSPDRTEWTTEGSTCPEGNAFELQYDVQGDEIGSGNPGCDIAFGVSGTLEIEPDGSFFYDTGTGEITGRIVSPTQVQGEYTQNSGCGGPWSAQLQ